MRRIDQKDFYQLRGGGGELFTGFVDAVIRTHGYVHGVGAAEILTSLRTNIADGGVDTQVRVAVPGDEEGYLTLASCWQYKAQEYKDLTGKLAAEIHKKYSTELIQAGYAYRLAICDDMPATTQVEWEAELTAEARKINPAAPAAKVATSSQLAAWANRYPSLLPTHFPMGAGPALSYPAWSRSITIPTRTYVLDKGRELIQEDIKSHIALTTTVLNPLFTIRGLAGVGKTRTVFEAISSAGAAENLVLYTSDGDDAISVARDLANDQRATAVLVADECPLESRATLDKILRGHGNRIRAVCIDNTADRLADNPERWLDVLPSGTVETILEINFPSVPLDRRRTYATQSGGYIRLAADLCTNDAQIQAKGFSGSALGSLHEYYLIRLENEGNQKVVEALSLVTKVGFGEGVTRELETLCGFTDLSPKEVLDTARKLKDVPGFIARTTRYLYVTPEIIARIAFDRAWRRWLEPNPDEALKRLPPGLLSSFQKRVASSASTEVRARVGEFFRRSVASFDAAHLTDDDAVESLTTLVRTSPSEYYPKLLGAIRSASVEDLTPRERYSAQRARRALVWIAEQLAAFPEYFWISEEVLRRLALVETESRISNNATGIWKQLFRIQLSGTSVAFAERIGFLRSLLTSPDQAIRTLAVSALSESFDPHGSRMVGPPVVAGLLVPEDWHPHNYSEFQQCLILILEAFDWILAGVPHLGKEVWATLARHLRFLLSHSMLPQIKKMYAEHPPDEGGLTQLLQSLDDFLHYECGDGTNEAFAPCAEAFKWREDLLPTDLLTRIKTVIGKDPWHHDMRERVHGTPSEIAPIADELASDPAKLDQALPFLSSPAAASAATLGLQLARLDPKAKLMDRILAAGREAAGGYGLARGYVSGLATSDTGVAQRLVRWMDELETGAPEMAYFLAIAAPDVSDALARTARMIKGGRLSVAYLQSFLYGDLFNRLSPGEFVEVLKLLVQDGQPASLHTAMDFVGYAIQRSRPITAEEREAIWIALAASASVDDGADYWWIQTLQNLAEQEPDRACDVAIAALEGKDTEKQDQSLSALTRVAERSPGLVLEKLQGLLLSKDKGWRLRLFSRTGLFQSLPLALMEDWLSKTGVEGARAVASHLPHPALDEHGKPSVHPLTEYVLTRWGEDREVFGRFLASTHQMQTYTGDIAAQHRAEADRARPFLAHTVPAVRRWAEAEVSRGEYEAREWTVRMEEEFLP